jgi:hypothetical protein
VVPESDNGKGGKKVGGTENVISPRGDGLTDDEKQKRHAANAEKGKLLQKQVPSLDLKDQMTDKKKPGGNDRPPTGKKDEESPETVGKLVDVKKSSSRPAPNPANKGAASQKYPTARSGNGEKVEMSDVNLKRT